MWSMRLKVHEFNQKVMESLGKIEEYTGYTSEEYHYLNPLQIIVANLRFNNVSYEKIQTLLQITSPNTIGVIIKLTACSIAWEQGRQGGKYSIISENMIKHLQKQIISKRKGLNCMKSYEGKQFILDEIEFSKRVALKRLRDWNSEGLCDAVIDMYEQFNLTDDVFADICNKVGVFIMKGQTLEHLRRQCCNWPIIRNFFSKIEVILNNVERKYLFNADETGLASKKIFRILTDVKKLNITSEPGLYEHISCMLC